MSPVFESEFDYQFFVRLFCPIFLHRRHQRFAIAAGNRVMMPREESLHAHLLLALGVGDIERYTDLLQLNPALFIDMECLH